VTTYRLGGRLTIESWERTLGSGPFTQRGAWDRRAVRNGLVFDLAKVQFADIAALARLLLLLDAAVRDEIQTQIRLPVGALTDGEREYLGRIQDDGTRTRHTQLLESQVLGRAKARSFLRHVGFDAALRPSHWPDGAVAIVDARVGDLTPGDAAADPGPTAPGAGEVPYRLGNIFPLRWFQPFSRGELRDSEFFLSVIAGLRGQVGLAASDARALAHAVLSELVENVAEHAARPGDREPPQALVGAVLLDPSTYRMRAQDLPAELRDYTDWVGDRRSAILRLVVGDSGVGLAERLGPAQREKGASSGVKIRGRAVDPTENTVFYAFDRWSTSSRQDDVAKRGTRGLWRVERLVRSYRGSVLVRTGRAYAGRVLAEDDQGIPVAVAGLGYAPGTLLDVNVLPDLDLPVPAPRPASGRADGLRFTAVHAAFTPGEGLAAPDQRRVQRAVEEAPRASEPQGVMVTLTAPGTRVYIESDIVTAALVAVSRIADPGVPIAVVVPDVNPHMLSLAVQEVTEQVANPPRPIWDSPYTTVLVIDRRGRPSWCGSPAPFTALLDALVAGSGSLARADANTLYETAGGSVDDLGRAVRDQQHVVSVDGDRIALRLRVEDVVRALREDVADTLRGAVEQAGPESGVLRGHFRTPTLRRTRRWVDVPQLLDATVGQSVAAFALARALEVELAAHPVADTRAVIARTGSMRARISTVLAECLGLRAEDVHPLPAELDLDRGAHSERVPAGQRVVLLSDLLSTENNVRRAAATVAGQRAEPAAIACVVDGRPRTAGIRLLNRTVPVVSLAAVDVGAPEQAESPIDIDPILRRPVQDGGPPEVPLVVSADTFLDWTSSVPGALRLGHIQGSSGSHFSAFPYLDVLLRDRTAARHLLAALVETTRELDVGRPIGIWHPGPRDDYAGRLAEALGQELQKAGRVVVSVESVPRVRAGARWVYPASFTPSAPAPQILLLDWGAVTASTVHQLLRLASAVGPERIVASIVISELGADEARALDILREVATVRTAESEEPTLFGETVRTSAHAGVAVRFVTTSAIEGFPLHACPMCRTRARYDVSQEGTPAGLQLHGAAVCEQLRPRARSDTTAAGTDLFGVHVGAEELADYLRWRGLFQSALRDTAARRELLEQVGRARHGTDAGSFRGWSLVRLLAAERQWLQLPPLRFTAGREMLGRLCEKMLLSPEAAILPEWLRVQAVMVLATSGSEQLVNLMPRLFRAYAPASVVLDEVLFQCQRLLRRPADDVPVEHSTLTARLQDLRVLLEHRDGDRAREHRTVVRDLLFLSARYARTRPATVQEAWSGLRGELVPRVLKHQLEAGWLNVQGLIEDLPRYDGPPALAPELGRRLEMCTETLADVALKHLRPLRELLVSDYFADGMRAADHARLVRLCDEDSDDALLALRQDVEALWTRPACERGAGWERLRRRVQHRMAWWYRFFIAAHRDSTDAPAILVDMLQTAPIRFPDAVEQAFTITAACTTVPADLAQAGPPVEAFCPQRLFDDVVGHVIGNAGRHQVSGETVAFDVAWKVRDDLVELRVRNSGSRGSATPGHGLEGVGRKLEAFGGAVTGRELGRSRWTYEARIVIPKWL
jgi:hypothetical protein